MLLGIHVEDYIKVQISFVVVVLVVITIIFFILSWCLTSIYLWVVSHFHLQIKMLYLLYISMGLQFCVLGFLAWLLCSPFLVRKLLAIVFFPIKGVKTKLCVLKDQHFIFQLLLNWSVYIFRSLVLVVVFLYKLLFLQKTCLLISAILFGLHLYLLIF